MGIARFEKTLERRPTPHGCCYLADAQIRREDFDAAQRACERAIAMEPGCEEAYFLYGEAVGIARDRRQSPGTGKLSLLIRNTRWPGTR